MRIIMHSPESAEGRANLGRQVAAVHGQTVVAYIKAMSCPEEQKMKLIEEICKRSGDAANMVPPLYKKVATRKAAGG